MNGAADTAFEILAEHRVFGGTIGYYRHQSAATGTPMRFTVFTPPVRSDGAVPVLWWLSGLTCTEDNFTVKAGAYRRAAELGLMVVAPDTSPRGTHDNGVPDDDSYDFGQGAGFYLDATQAPWDRHFNMGSYVARDLPETVFTHFPADPHRQGIFGHSMGGHGALTLGLKNPETYRSISAFAPICAPMQCPWGEKAFSGYLGQDRAAWQAYDATVLMQVAGDRSAFPPILIDQGADDPFLGRELKPHLFEAACARSDQALSLRYQGGYDHSYFFIASFIDDHMGHHVRILGV